MKVIKVSTKKKLEELRNASMFTWEGMNDDEENLKKIEKIIRRYGFKQEEMTIYIFKGELMNKAYKLTGYNKYSNDLTFVSVADYYDPIVKVQLNARWLDDIIENNLYREQEGNK